MTIVSEFKKIRLKLKFGRVVEAEEALLALLNEVRGTPEEIELLAIYCFDLEMPTGRYESAANGFQRLLALDITKELRQRVESSLLQCHAINDKTVIAPDYSSPDFVEFMAQIPILLNKENGDVNKFSANWIEVFDFNEALRLGHDQNIPPPFFSWNKARALAAKEVNSYCFENKISTILFDTEKSKEISDIVTGKLHGRMGWFADDIFGDLIEIARGKLVGKKTKLHTLMCDAYLTGFFPCGWRGDYPDGKIVVYDIGGAVPTSQ
jgi:hypothetical protein